MIQQRINLKKLESVPGRLENGATDMLKPIYYDVEMFNKHNILRRYHWLVFINKEKI